MSSTSAGAAGPPPGILDEIKALFAWNPPPLVPVKKSSIATRPPSFFDKHFSEESILKWVKRLPTLVMDLAKNVDTALDTASNTLPPLDDFCFTTKQRKYDVETLSHRVPDEKAVANFYDKTTARYCSVLASTLALHPTASFSQWRNLLSWTQSGPSSGHAITDGQLCFNDNRDQENWKAIVESMDNKIRPIFEEMMESGSPLATWEIKRPSTGRPEVMASIPNLGKFFWTRCLETNCLELPKHQKSKKNAGKVSIGPDAQVPPWRLPDDTTHCQPAIPAESGSPTAPPPSASPPSEHTSDLRKDKGKKRKREESEDDNNDGAYKNRFDITEQNIVQQVNHPERVTRQTVRLAAVSGSSTMPPPRASPKDKNKKRKQEESEEDNNNNDRAYQDHFDITAQNIVQQAWAQAARVDGTIIILHSGNHELVCLRHRTSQTLYVSDIIEPPNCVDPGYGKLHVGIYIAAIQDVIDRKQQQQLLSPQIPPSDGGETDQDDKDRIRGSGSRDRGGRRHGRGRPRGGRSRARGLGKGQFRDSAGRAGPSDGAATEKTIQAASSCDRVFLYLQYNLYNSPVPSSFTRSAPSIPLFSPQAISDYGPPEYSTIILTSEIGQGASGVALRGTFTSEFQDCPLDIVVKLAFDTEQRDALKTEYEVYRHLKSKGVDQGIARTLGLFDDSENTASALTMLYAGTPLSIFEDDLSISDRESALLTLKAIHRAGILHGDIRRENILISPSGVTIIDFGCSIQANYKRAKDQEVTTLCDFLGLVDTSQ